MRNLSPDIRKTAPSFKVSIKEIKKCKGKTCPFRILKTYLILINLFMIHYHYAFSYILHVIRIVIVWGNRFGLISILIVVSVIEVE